MSVICDVERGAEQGVICGAERTKAEKWREV
jgi:hypothetical protein